MNNHAIYYPYISLPNSKWLMENLLYWDKLSSIVPYQVKEYGEGLSPFMKDLISSNLVNLVEPREYNDDLDEFRDGFIEFAKKYKNTSSEYTRIHMEKIGNLREQLLDLNLIENDNYPWVLMKDDLSDHFMEQLATSLSLVDELDATPITNKGTFNLNSLVSQRNDVLSFAMPLPNDEISIDKILRFKEDYGHLTRGFRNKIEKITLNILSQKDEELRNHTFNVEKDDFKRELEELNEAISLTWTNKIEKNIIPLIGTGVAYGTSGPVAGAITLSTAIIPQVIEYFKINKNPLIYATGMERYL